MKKAPASGTSLSKADAELWQAWKRATDLVLGRVGRDISLATGLSGADYGVLSQLVDLGGGQLRQHELASAMAWHKSRLSHHLSRMEERALVRRKQASVNSVLVAITAAGKRALGQARPVHAQAIRQHLADKVTPAERKPWLALLTRLADE